MYEYYQYIVIAINNCAIHSFKKSISLREHRTLLRTRIINLSDADW